MLVLIPNDTASNNITIICKQYYVKVILNEIGVIVHGKNTWKSDKSYDEIIDENAEYIKHLGFKVTEKEKILPIMYWIRKLYTNPTGARFIIVSKIIVIINRKIVWKVVWIEYYLQLNLSFGRH